MRHCDKVEKLISRWIQMLSVTAVRKTQTTEECIVIKFKRCRWFREHFNERRAKVVKKRERDAILK